MSLMQLREATCLTNGVFVGKVLNQPNQLTSVSNGSEILFIVPESGEYPLLVTKKYLQERSDWIIHPCSQCGFSELFGTPSELIRGIFSQAPPDAVIGMFTAKCGICGGGLVIQHKDYDPEDEESQGGVKISELTPDKTHRNKAWWQFWKR